MPRYHFNIYDGLNILDHEGAELKDLDQACIKALRYAASIIKDGARKKRLANGWRLEVMDAQGATLFRLDLSMTSPSAPARSSTTDKVDSLADEPADSIKHGVDTAIGNENQKAEDKAQKAKGEVKDSPRH